ncbi:MAG: hypothetical protein DSY66_01895 [Persephonella sp.]|nr:MAG: hypothetical protein DSY66_01895 [Persephonella sp.]
MENKLNEYKDLIDGLFILSSEGMMLEGYLPSGWTEENVYFGIFPIINILKNISKDTFADITEAEDYTMVITTPDTEVFICVIGNKKKAPLGFLLTTIQEIYSAYLEKYGSKKENIEEIIERWRTNLS